MTAYKQLGEWIADTFGRALKTQNDTVLINNSTTLDLAGVSNFSFISIMEDQHHGQQIWGWKVEGMRAGSEQWEVLSRGGSIGHKRLINCAELTPTAKFLSTIATDVDIDSWHSMRYRHNTRSEAAAADPPAPPAQPDDVLFTTCERAHGWVVKADGTVRATINTSASEEVCLTLDGLPHQFQFVSAKPCKGTMQQHWKFPWKPGQPALAFAGGGGGARTAATVATTTASHNKTAAALVTQQCVQILGNAPWIGQRAIVWDCQDGAADEHVDMLPTTPAGFEKLKIDMTSYGSGPLCMVVRAGVGPPAPRPSCEGIDALRFSVTESASSNPAALRQFAVY